MDFITIISDMKAWIKSNFGDMFTLDAVEINPYIYDSVATQFRKESYVKGLHNETVIVSIIGVKILRSSNPLSGFHFKLLGVGDLIPDEGGGL